MNFTKPFGSNEILQMSMRAKLSKIYILYTHLSGTS
jgi:hypothetical protein